MCQSVLRQFYNLLVVGLRSKKNTKWSVSILHLLCIPSYSYSYRNFPHCAYKFEISLYVDPDVYFLVNSYYMNAEK